jgi:FlaG/FlaF family flagellin (archaellin)
MIGPEVRMKIYTILCIAICVILAASIAPNVIGAVIANWVSF